MRRGRRLGKERAARDQRRSSTAATAAPARTARSRPPSTSPASATPGPTGGRRRARHGQAGVRRRRCAAAGLPTLPRAAARPPTGAAAGFAGPYIVKPRFGGSSIGIEIADDLDHGPGPACGPQPHYRAGAVVEPYLPDAVDLNVSVPRVARAAAVGHREAAAAAAGGEHLRATRTSTWRRARACSARARGSCRPILPDGVAEQRPGGWPAAWPAVALVRGGRPHRLPVARRRRLRQRDQHDPRLAGLVLLGAPRACVRRLAGDMIAEAAAAPARSPTRPMAPTARR